VALAFGFYDNGMNFFKPRTLSQFSKDGVVGVEFPILSYLTALTAKLFSRNSIPLVFRVLNLLVVAVCLQGLFGILLRFCRNALLAAIVPLLFLLSPSFLSYACNFLPDAVATSIAVLGIGFYMQSWWQGQHARRYAALLLLVLATLIKTSVGIYLIGFVCIDVYLLGKERGALPINRLKYVAAVLISFVSIAGYILYSRHLSQAYDSTLFLLNVNPFNAGQVKRFLTVSLPIWAPEYFVPAAYFFLILLFVLGYRNRVQSVAGGNQLVLLVTVLILGILSMSYLVGAQFIDHDYYILPIYFPLIMFLAMLAVIKIDSSKNAKPLSSVLGGLLALVLILSFVRTRDRLSDRYRGFSDYYNTEWMKDGAGILEQYKIPKAELIAVFNENPPNLSLIYFDRKGYAVNNGWWVERYESAAHFMGTRNLKVGVIKKAEFERINQSDSTFYQHFEVIGAEQSMVLFRPKK
jgi:MFS family permease